jgi:succinate dehydrogenase/fumarate reductase flavoprotein subunit
MRLGLERGAELSSGLDEFYGRNMPDADFTEEQFVPFAQLYGRTARVFNERGEEFFGGEVSWSENDLVQATAQQPGARAWYLLDDEALKDRDVAERVARAPTRTEPDDLPFTAPSGTRVGVRVKPGITHTIGGLRIDEHARVAESLYAAGADVGGISTGGYASGLAAALVFGRIAAESALSSL